MEVGNAEAATNQSVAQVPGSLRSAAGSRACTRPIAARWPNLGLVPARRGAVQRRPPPAAPRGGTPQACARNTTPVAPTRWVVSRARPFRSQQRLSEPRPSNPRPLAACAHAPFWLLGVAGRASAGRFALRRRAPRRYPASPGCRSSRPSRGQPRQIGRKRDAIPLVAIPVIESHHLIFGEQRGFAAQIHVGQNVEQTREPRHERFPRYR